MYDSVAIFGAGTVGEKAWAEMTIRNISVECFIDNYKAGGDLYSIPVISLDDFLNKYKSVNVVVAVSALNRISIVNQLDEKKVKYSVFGIPIWKVRYFARYKKYYLFGFICVYKGAL